LKKIEELTLYLIEKNKQITEQNNQIKIQQAELAKEKENNKQQEARLQALEKSLKTSKY
jgi:ribosomal protein L9